MDDLSHFSWAGSDPSVSPESDKLSIDAKAAYLFL